MTETRTIRDLISTVGLIPLGLRYSGFCWKGWKGGMQKKLDNPDHPFSGAPKVGTVVILASGGTKTLTVLDRLRINEVTDETLDALGVLDAAKKCRAASKPKEDIFHPEFVTDFDTLRALNHGFLLNNLVPSVNLMTWVADEYATPTTTTVEFCTFAGYMLAGERRDDARRLNLAIRHGWLSRKVVAQEYEGNRDMVPSYDLSGDVYALDGYVVVPVLTEFKSDIETGKFDN